MLNDAATSVKTGVDYLRTECILLIPNLIARLQALQDIAKSESSWLEFIKNNNQLVQNTYEEVKGQYITLNKEKAQLEEMMHIHSKLMADLSSRNTVT